MSRKNRNAESVTVDNGEAKPVESKADKFRRLAMQRVPKAVARLRQIAALANKTQYEWTEEQREKIELAIAAEVKKIQQSFNGTKVREEAFEL